MSYSLLVKGACLGILFTREGEEGKWLEEKKKTDGRKRNGERWKGRRVEEEWKKSGRRVEEEWKKSGRRVEEEWKKSGRREGSEKLEKNRRRIGEINEKEKTRTNHRETLFSR